MYDDDEDNECYTNDDDDDDDNECYTNNVDDDCRRLFEDAEEEEKRMGPNSGLHIIIFDEIDAICKARGSVAGNTGQPSCSSSPINPSSNNFDDIFGITTAPRCPRFICKKKWAFCSSCYLKMRRSIFFYIMNLISHDDLIIEFIKSFT